MPFCICSFPSYSCLHFLLDIKGAVDDVIHELILGNRNATDLRLKLINLNLDNVAVGSLLNQINTASSILSASSVPATLQSVVQYLMEGSFYLVEGCASVLALTRGAKPGNSLADILWGFISSTYLSQLRQQLQALDLQTTIGNSAESQNDSHCTFFGPGSNAAETLFVSRNVFLFIPVCR